MNATRLEYLQNLPVFAGLKEETLEFLTSSAGQVEKGPGEYFFRDGDHGQSLFVIESGEAGVFKEWQGEKYQLAKFFHGDCFGEMEIINPCPRFASVIAISRCNAMEILDRDLLALYRMDLEQFTIIQMNMAREVCRRLRNMDQYLFENEIASRQLTPLT